MLTVLAGHFALVGGAIVIQDLLARAGRGPERWLTRRLPAPSGRWATGWFLGLTAWGSALLGLAATGLFTPAAVIALLPLLAVASRAGRPAASPLLAAVRHRVPVPIIALGAAALPLVPVLARLISPHHDVDSLIYHLSYPSQCLIARKVTLEHVTWSFHFPLLADLTHALPIALGDDRLAKWTALTALVATTAIAAARYPGCGWLFLLVALSPRSHTWLATLTKNDVAAGGLLVAGALLWRSGPRTVAAVLLGASIASKPTGAPVAFIWVICHAHACSVAVRQARRAMLLSVLFALPLLPWLIKSWIATGDPAHPHLWKLLGEPFWGSANQASLESQAIWNVEAGHRATLPREWLRAMAVDFPLQLIALPLLAVAGRRRAALAAGLGAAAIMYTARMSRYMLPAGWLLSVELAAATAAIPGPRGPALRAGLALASLALMAGWSEMREVPWRSFVEPVAAVRRADLGAVADLADDLAGRRITRVLLTGANPSYPLPARVLYDGFNGERPIVRTLAAASRDAERLRVGFRQLGPTAIAHNFVSVDWTAVFYRPFPWTDRMLGTYAAFARGRLTPLAAPRRADRQVGGYWLLRLDAGAGHRSPAPVIFLPGSEAALLPARELRGAGDHAAAEREWRRLLAVAPGVAHLASQLGQTLTARGRWLEAYGVFAPLTARGFIDGASLWGHGTAAIYAGKYDEAERVLLKSIEIYDTKHANRVNLAWCYQARADSVIRNGGGAAAEPWLRRAEATLALIPPATDTYWSTPRRQIEALVTGSRADLLRAAGHRNAAADLYRRAVAEGHDLPDARRWERLAH